MKTVAYLRVSTGSQDLANQKIAVLDYARQQAIFRRPFRRGASLLPKDPGPAGH